MLPLCEICGEREVTRCMRLVGRAEARDDTMISWTQAPGAPPPLPLHGQSVVLIVGLCDECSGGRGWLASEMPPDMPMIVEATEVPPDNVLPMWHELTAEPDPTLGQIVAHMAAIVGCMTKQQEQMARLAAVAERIAHRLDFRPQVP